MFSLTDEEYKKICVVRPDQGTMNLRNNIYVDTLVELAKSLGMEQRSLQELVEHATFKNMPEKKNGEICNIKLVDNASVLTRMYKPVQMSQVVDIGYAQKYFFVHSTGIGEFRQAIVSNGQAYYVPTVSVNEIVPVKIIEEGGKGMAKAFDPLISLCTRTQPAAVGVKLYPTTRVDVPSFPLEFIVGPNCISHGERFMLGTCVEDGNVIFPYDGMRADMPLKTGERVVIALCVKDRIWKIVDVVSYRRELLLCVLKSWYMMDPQGLPLMYSVGSKFSVTTDLISFLNRTRLSNVDGVQLPDGLDVEIRGKMNKIFEHAHFEFLNVYSEEIARRDFKVFSVEDEPIVKVAMGYGKGSIYRGLEVYRPFTVAQFMMGKSRLIFEAPADQLFHWVDTDKLYEFVSARQMDWKSFYRKIFLDDDYGVSTMYPSSSNRFLMTMKEDDISVECLEFVFFSLLGLSYRRKLGSVYFSFRQLCSVDSYPDIMMVVSSKMAVCWTRYGLSFLYDSILVSKVIWENELKFKLVAQFGDFRFYDYEYVDYLVYLEPMLIDGMVRGTYVL